VRNLKCLFAVWELLIKILEPYYIWNIFRFPHFVYGKLWQLWCVELNVTEWLVFYETSVGLKQLSRGTLDATWRRDSFGSCLISESCLNAIMQMQLRFPSTQGGHRGLRGAADSCRDYKEHKGAMGVPRWPWGLRASTGGFRWAWDSCRGPHQ
jgi:hypothetical protein